MKTDGKADGLAGCVAITDPFGMYIEMSDGLAAVQ
jgi:hypothetical protein